MLPTTQRTSFLHSTKEIYISYVSPISVGCCKPVEISPARRYTSKGMSTFFFLVGVRKSGTTIFNNIAHDLQRTQYCGILWVECNLGFYFTDQIILKKIIIFRDLWFSVNCSKPEAEKKSGYNRNVFLFIYLWACTLVGFILYVLRMKFINCSYLNISGVGLPLANCASLQEEKTRSVTLDDLLPRSDTLRGPLVRGAYSTYKTVSGPKFDPHVFSRLPASVPVKKNR